MKGNKLDHICIAVRNLDEARKVWEPMLGKTAPDDAYVDELCAYRSAACANCNVVHLWIS